MRRKILAMILALTVVLGMSTTVFAADAPSSWAKAEVEEAIALDFVPADLQENYQDDITREDFCTLIITMLSGGNAGLDAILQAATDEAAAETTGSAVKETTDSAIKADESYENPFTDTENINVLIAYELGIVTGVSEGVFDPSGKITRQQAATMLMRAAKAAEMDVTAKASTFADNDKIASYAKDGVNFVAEKGIMGGVGNNNFSPATFYTKEQAILTILRLYKEAAPEESATEPTE